MNGDVFFFVDKFFGVLLLLVLVLFEKFLVGGCFLLCLM